MKISGETMIFKNDKGFYSTSVKNKLLDGTYENMYIPVNFKKGIEVHNKTKINVSDGFISFYKTKEGLPKIKLVVTDFEEIYVPNDEEGKHSEITDSNLDLPF